MKKILMLLLVTFFVGVGNSYAQKDEKSKDKSMKSEEMKMEKNEHHKMGNLNEVLKDWPEATKMSAEKMVKAFGNPDGVTDMELIWYKAGPWEMIRLSKEETPHKFPVAHTDYLEMTIFHEVPVEKMDELGEFDGSVTFDRTQGYFSARCDLEANNFLALNLAHDIINDKKSVDEARTAYADIIKEKMNGGNPEYMQALQFEVETNAAADADINTTGLTKKEVMEAIKANKKM